MIDCPKPTQTTRIPTVIAIGGIDPSGGAGLFVDQRAIVATGCQFAGICATLTIQNGITFIKSTPQPAADVADTLALLVGQRPVAAIKTGALGTKEVAAVICQFKAMHPHIPLIVDPVLKSTTGGDLIAGEGDFQSLQAFFNAADLLTPNLHEIEKLTGMQVQTPTQMEAAAQWLLDNGVRGVLVKGGHLDAEQPVDILALHGQPIRRITGQRLFIDEVRGTGCALASLIAGQIALGESMVYGVEKARSLLMAAMANAWFPGKGPGILQF